jgi:hypothetical protein
MAGEGPSRIDESRSGPVSEGSAGQPQKLALTGEEINWQVISAGATDATSTHFELVGTVGQNATGEATSTNMELYHGFWQVFGSGTCCIPPTVGDCDQSGGVDITDIQVLVDNQFLTLTPLVCEAEGDCDFSGVVDITDLQILIDNQFLTLTPLSPCP